MITVRYALRVICRELQIQRNLFVYEAGKTRVWRLTVKMEVEFNT